MEHNAASVQTENHETDHQAVDEHSSHPKSWISVTWQGVGIIITAITAVISFVFSLGVLFSEWQHIKVDHVAFYNKLDIMEDEIKELSFRIEDHKYEDRGIPNPTRPRVPFSHNDSDTHPPTNPH